MLASGLSLSGYRAAWELEQIGRGETVPHFAARFREGWITRDAEPYYPKLGGRPTSERSLAERIIRCLDSEEGIYLLGDCKEREPKLLEALKAVTHIPSEILGFMRFDGARAQFMIDRKAYFTNGSPIDVYVQWYVSRGIILKPEIDAHMPAQHSQSG